VSGGVYKTVRHKFKGCTNVRAAILISIETCFTPDYEYFGTLYRETFALTDTYIILVA
jgi:hypothetical protein